MAHLTKLFMCTFVMSSHFMLLRSDDADNLNTQGRRPKRSARKFAKSIINSYLPKMVVFDPDMVFWPFITETEVIPPFGIRSYQPTTAVVRRLKKKTTIAKYGVRELVDRNGTVLTLHPEALEVLSRFHKKEVKMAVASTSEAIATMRHILHLFDIDHVFSHMEIDLESPIEHLNLIKNESSIDFNGFIYFGANQTVLSTIKRQFNILTVKVNPEKGVTLLDAYSAIYLFNLRPCVAIKDGKIQMLKELISEEEIVTERSQTDKMFHNKINKITKDKTIIPMKKRLAPKRTTSTLINTPFVNNTSDFQSIDELESRQFSNVDQIPSIPKERSSLWTSSEERKREIGQCLAGVSEHYESKFSSRSEEMSVNIGSQYSSNKKISQRKQLDSENENDDSSTTLIDNHSKGNIIMGIESYEQWKHKKGGDKIKKGPLVIPTLGPVFHNKHTKIMLFINKTSARNKIRTKQKQFHSNNSTKADKLTSATPKLQAKQTVTRKFTRTVKKSHTNKTINNNNTEYVKRLKPKRISNRKGRGRTLLLTDDSTIICRRDGRLIRARTTSPLNLRNRSTADILSSELEPYPDHLKAVHINAQSLVCHIAEVRDVFRLQSADIIGISESWLKQNVSNDEVSLPGYSLFRNDRVIKKGGGVALYVRNGLGAKVVFTSESTYEAKPELLFIDIEFSSVKTLVGVCYRQPKIGFMVELEYALLRLTPDYKHVLLMGDFNIDLLADDLNYDYNSLTKMLDYLKLALVPLAATHHAVDSHTLLDLLAVGGRSRVVHHGQLPVVNISRHDLIFCVLSLSSQETSLIT